MSRTACKVQCPQCPFRASSLPGWLGSYTPASVFQGAWFNQPFYCHTKVDYENPNWEAKTKRSGKVCLGSLAFANAMMAPKRVDSRPELADTVADQQLVINLRAAILGSREVDDVMGPRAFNEHHSKS